MNLKIVGCLAVIIAGINGDLTFSPPLPSPNYTAAGTTYEDGGMGPMFDFARSFINTCLPDIEQMIQVVKNIINHKLALNLDSILKLVKDKLLGFSVSIAVGILFIILFPIVGCCFCCCRFCCKCCCTKPEEEDPSASCKAKVYGTILFALVAFTAAGNACVYLTNDRISLALTEIEDNVDKNLDDFSLFMNHTVQQVEQIRVDFQITKKEINTKLNSSKLSDTLQKTAIAYFTGGDVDELQKEISQMKVYMENISNGIDDLKAAAGPLAPPFPKLPPLPNGTDSISSTATAQIEPKIANALSGVTGTIDGAKDKINDADKEINSIVNDTKEAIQSGDAVDIDSIKLMIKDNTEMIKPYNKYRWYAGIGCAGIVTLMLSLQFCGICMGVFGGCGKGDPFDKGCMSNCGGRLMIASVIFTFLFGALLMLVTTLLFIPGSIVERYVCQPFTDPDLKFFDKIVDEFGSLQSFIEYEKNHERELSDLLKGCKQNQAIYTALDVDHLKMMNFKFSDLENKVEGIIKNMRNQSASALKGFLTNGGEYGSVSLIPPDLQSSLDDVKNIFNDTSGVNFAELDKNIHSIEDLLKKQVLPPANQTRMTSALKEIKDGKNGLYRQKGIIPKTVDKVKDQLQNATKKIQSDGMTKIAGHFINETVDVVSIFFNQTKDAVYKDLGQCQPIWNLYNSIINISICKYTVDALNGFWFSIGWCIFFLLPISVFGTKLSNLLRDIDYDSGKGTKRNKVGHADI